MRKSKLRITEKWDAKRKEKYYTATVFNKGPHSGTVHEYSNAGDLLQFILGVIDSTKTGESQVEIYTE